MKARIVQVGNARGQKAARLHLSYLERDGVDREGTPGALYGAAGTVERAEFAEPLPGENHQFRLVISPEDGHALDLETFVRDYMAQVQQDVGRELIWAAVNHYNTDNPHAHILIRGVDAQGAEVRLDRAYVSHGLRHRAEDLVTERLGPRPERSRLDQLKQDAELERYTALDRELERRAQGTVRRPRVGPGRDPHLEAALRRRLEVLEGLGLAKPAGPADWRLAVDLREQLQAMARRAEGLRAIRSVLRATRYRVIDRAEPNRPDTELDRGAHGAVRWKGLDEHGHFVAVVETTAGAAYYLPVTSRAAAEVRVGQLVELKRAADKDAHIEEAARGRGGVFDLATLPETARPAYRYRLEQLQRLALAAADPAAPDRWTVRADFRGELAKGKPQPLWQMLSMRPEQQPLGEQRLYPGPVWLDRVRPEEVGSRGLGGEVGEALAARREYLRRQGLEPGADNLHWRLLKVQRAALERTLAARGGAVARSPDGLEGTVHLHREPNGQQFVEIRSSTGHFALVQAPRGAEALRGQQVRLSIGDKGRPHFALVDRDRGPER